MRLRPAARKLGFRPAAPGARSWVDLAIFLWLAWVFDAINNLAPVRQSLAEHHAHQLLGVERSLHLAPELSVNTWLAAHRVLSQVVVFWYDNVHVYVTFGVIIWLWWRRPDLLAGLRAALVLATAAAAVVFWAFPVAPPRMLTSAGYLDLVARSHGLTVWQGGAVADHANQLMAMPSLHIAWAVWVSIVVWRMSSRAWLRALAVSYPLLTTFAVMATGNHFLGDALAGAALVALAFAAVELVALRRAATTAPAPAFLSMPAQNG